MVLVKSSSLQHLILLNSEEGAFQVYVPVRIEMKFFKIQHCPCER